MNPLSIETVNELVAKIECLTAELAAAREEAARLWLALDTVIKSLLMNLQPNLLDAEAALRGSTTALDAVRAGTETWWDQHSVQCGNCQVQIVARKGDIPNNNGLSTDGGGEDEHLCGRCAGQQMYVYQDELAEHGAALAQARREGAADWLERYAGYIGQILPLTKEECLQIAAALREGRG